MKRLFAICLFFFLLHGKYYAQTFTSVITDGTYNLTSGMSLASDTAGNLFVAEIYRHPSIIGGISIIKYDSNHNFVWRHNIEGNYINSYSISTDKVGDVYFCGTFNNSIYIDAVQYSTSDYHMFLVKFDASGNFLWLRRSTGIGATASKVVTDSQNNVYVAGNVIGNFSGSTYFDSITASSVAGVAYTYIAKYNSAGNILWLKQTKGGGASWPAIGLKIDGANNLYLASTFYSWFVAGTYTVNAYGTYPDQDAYLAKMDANGNWLWAKNVVGGTGQELFYDMDLDVNGNPHITGYFDSPTIHFGSITQTSAGSGDFLVAKFDGNGNSLWATTGGGPGIQSASGICVDLNGTSYVARSSVFFSKFDNTGVYIGSEFTPTDNYDMLRDNSGCIYVTGNIDTPTNFGSYNITPTQSQQMYVAKYCNSAVSSSINELTAGESFLIYPNPANGKFIVKCSEDLGNYSLNIKNSLGQIIYTEKQNKTLTSFVKEIDLDKQAKGIYFIELQSNSNKSVVKKIVLQ